MIWVTWAQHRREALVSGLILTVAAALLVITGLIMLADFQSSGAASCAPAAGPAVGVFNAVFSLGVAPEWMSALGASERYGTYLPWPPLIAPNDSLISLSTRSASKSPTATISAFFGV